MPDDIGQRKVRVSEQETLAKQGDFLRLDRYNVEYPKFASGEFAKAKYVNVHRNDAVAGLLHILGAGPHEGKQSLLLVEQFRFPTVIGAETGVPDLNLIDEQNEEAGRILELMAGVQQPGEPPLESFRRECKEETGQSPKKVVYISSFYPSPGACSEQIHLYYGSITWPANEPWPETQDPEDSDFGDETENIRLHYYTPKEFLEMIAAGKLVDGKCYAAAEWMRRPEIASGVFKNAF